MVDVVVYRDAIVRDDVQSLLQNSVYRAVFNEVDEWRQVYRGRAVCGEGNDQGYEAAVGRYGDGDGCRVVGRGDPEKDGSVAMSLLKVRSGEPEFGIRLPMSLP